MPRPQGYISGVHFQKCSNFSIIFFTLKISTENVTSKGRRKGPLNTLMLHLTTFKDS